MMMVQRCLIAGALVLGLTLVGCGEREQQTAPPANAPAQPQAGPQPGSTPQVSVADGQKLFQQTCAACHGMEGQGVPNLGKDMRVSAFIKAQSDDELLAFIKRGRMPSDPGNTTGVAMPPKGGNPALQDGQLRAIIAYIRTLQP